MLSGLLLISIIGSVLVAFAGNNSTKMKQIALTTTFQKIFRFRWGVILMSLVTGETVNPVDVAPYSADEVNLCAVYVERPPTPKELMDNSVTTSNYPAMIDGTSATLGTVVSPSYNTEPIHIVPDGSPITVDSRLVSPSDTQFSSYDRYVIYGNSNSSILSNMVGSLHKFLFGSPLYCDADVSVIRLHDVANSAPTEGHKQYLLSHLPTQTMVTELHAKLAQHGTIIIILAMTLKSLNLVGILLFILFIVNKYFDKIVLIFPQSVQDSIRVTWQWTRIPIAIFLSGNFVVGIYAAYKGVNFLLQNPIKYEDVKAMSNDEDRVTNINRPHATIEELENDLL